MPRFALQPAPARVWLTGLATLLLTCLALLGVILFFPEDGAPTTTPERAVVFNPDGSLRQPVHWHADFAVVINGEQFDFNQPAFISTEGNETNPTVHIHEPRPTVVHVHREQTTWDEFMRSLGFGLSDTALTLPDGRAFSTGPDGQLRFFVNGTAIDTLAFESIADLSQVLITFGTETEEEIRRDQLPMVSNQACIPSELCRDRMPAEPEKEPCTRSSDACTG